MCNPVAVFAVSAAMAAYAKYQEGQAQAEQLERQVKLQDQQAGDARLRGQVQEGMVRLDTGQDIAKQHLAYSAAGVDPSQGSPRDVYKDTAALGELKALDVENNAIREAWGYEMSASTSRARARDARRLGSLGAVSSLIGGAASVYGANSSLNSPLNSTASDLASTRGSNAYPYGPE